jgi:hypothetical protein
VSQLTAFSLNHFLKDRNYNTIINQITDKTRGKSYLKEDYKSAVELINNYNKSTTSIIRDEKESGLLANKLSIELDSLINNLLLINPEFVVFDKPITERLIINLVDNDIITLSERYYKMTTLTPGLTTRILDDYKSLIQVNENTINDYNNNLTEHQELFKQVQTQKSTLNKRLVEQHEKQDKQLSNPSTDNEKLLSTIDYEITGINRTIKNLDKQLVKIESTNPIFKAVNAYIKRLAIESISDYIKNDLNSGAELKRPANLTGPLTKLFDYYIINFKAGMNYRNTLSITIKEDKHCLLELIKLVEKTL